MQEFPQRIITAEPTACETVNYIDLSTALRLFEFWLINTALYV